MSIATSGARKFALIVLSIEGKFDSILGVQAQLETLWKEILSRGNWKTFNSLDTKMNCPELDDKGIGESKINGWKPPSIQNSRLRAKNFSIARTTGSAS
jgi:hypothetical protein